MLGAIPIPEESTFLSSLHLAKAKIPLTLFHVLAALIDILITAGLTLTLSKALTHFKKGDGSTRSILQRLLLYTASRGILITIVQIGHIIMYLVDPKNLMFCGNNHQDLVESFAETDAIG
ncbi:hypothetical protein D9615_008511 [Tricholomella constricta]|uniref:DUF6534 domain-containing protein n=1 Tax=Tricholomella constricta TaxID=117010 RepID=A0A8H5M0M1_9AGAR|nr:hypothetical protein D9615_008511 [Tricholomella constricta]